jgi:hypothetical protein
MAIRFLRHVEPKVPVKAVIYQLESLEKNLEAVGFVISNVGIKEENLIEELKLKNENDLIGQEIASKIQEAMKIFEHLVYAEALTNKIYLLPKRRFNSEYLQTQPQKFFKDDLFDKLTVIAKFDIASSCRCLLYGEGTACAFHILRATEEVLKQYYFKYKKTKRLTKSMWGEITSELRAKKTNRPPDVILNSLDNVRTSYRNPTQHPETIYDIQTAQDLFGVCVDLINKMGE